MKPSIVFLALVTVLATVGRTPPAAAQEIPDTLVFLPTPYDSFDNLIPPGEPEDDHDDEWLRTPIGDGLLTDREQWRAAGEREHRLSGHFDYNRVDRVRIGLGYQLQVPAAMAPRLGGRLAYAIGRERTLYGFQIEQPIIPPGRISLGASMVRRTDHHELHQISNLENSLALLFARQDYRDYWEREGIGLYLAWWVPDFSTVSLHLRSDDFRTLPEDPGVVSWAHSKRPLRPNPPVDDGESHTVALRLERGAPATSQRRTGFYHWFEVERAGAGMGGDFDYTRLLGDLRSVLRLSPAATLMLRMVAGYTPAGTLPAQKQFPLGGVDGLRGHDFAVFRGDQAALFQAEYVIGLWRLRTGAFEGGLHAIVFVDAGHAWFDPGHHWSLFDQKLAVDGGIGLGAAEDKLRIYFAKDLRNNDSDFVITARLQRPF